MEGNNEKVKVYDIDQNIPQSQQKLCPITQLRKHQITDVCVNEPCGHFYSFKGLIQCIQNDIITLNRIHDNNCINLLCESTGNNRKPMYCPFSDCTERICYDLTEEVISEIEKIEKYNK